VVSSTIKAASLFAAGQAAATGAISVKVTALTEGVLKTMSLTKMKTATVGFLLAVAAFWATAGLMFQTRAAEQSRSENANDKISTAWGKQVDGLQAGIRLKAIDILNAANQWEATQPGGKIHQGSVLRFEVIVRNVSKQEVRLKYIQPSGWPCSEDGQDLKFTPAYLGGKPILYEKTLQPGEDWEVAQLNITTRKPKPAESFSGLRLLEQGKFKVSCPSVLMQEKKGKLATGEVEVEIVPPKGGEPGKIEQGRKDKNENQNKR
jgi:hypothetical protein